jgi:hypothetical protein
MTIFKKIMLLIATLSVAMLPFGFSYFSNTSQSWIDIFGKGEALLLGVVFAADVLGRCFVQTKDRPSRLIIGLIAGLVCLAELPFYGKASTAGAGAAAAEPIAFWSLICLAFTFFLQIAVILDEEL